MPSGNPKKTLQPVLELILPFFPQMSAFDTMLQEDTNITKIILNLSIKCNDLSFQFREDLTAHARKTLDSTELCLVAHRRRVIVLVREGIGPQNANTYKWLNRVHMK